MQCTCAILCCHLWPVWLYHIFPHYLINGMICGKVIEPELCGWYSLQLLSETFLILRRVEWVIVINVLRSACKISVVIVRFYWNLNFIDRFLKNTEISNLVKICWVQAELFHGNRCTDRQTDRGMEKMKLIVAFHNFANVAK